MIHLILEHGWSAPSCCSDNRLLVRSDSCRSPEGENVSTGHLQSAPGTGTNVLSFSSCYREFQQLQCVSFFFFFFFGGGCCLFSLFIFCCGLHTSQLLSTAFVVLYYDQFTERGHKVSISSSSSFSPFFLSSVFNRLLFLL